MMRVRAFLLRGQCLAALGRYSEALADYTSITDHRESASASHHHLGQYEAKGLYQSAVCLVAMKDYRSAVGLLSLLIHPTEKEVAGLITINAGVTAWRAKAVELMATLKQSPTIAEAGTASKKVSKKKSKSNTTSRPPLPPPPTISSSNPNNYQSEEEEPESELGRPSLAVSYPGYPIGRCTYSSAGRLEDDANDYFAETIIIERLQWVILWVRGDILIWDYGKEEVVHWLLLEEGCVEDTSTTKLVDLPEHDSALYFHGSRKYGLQLIDLLRLSPRGGKTDIKRTDLFATVSPGSFTYHVMTPRKSLPIVPSVDEIQTWILDTSGQLRDCIYLAASKDSAGQWRLAVSHEKRLVVDVYREDKIRSGTAMGPFFITANSKPSFELMGNEAGAQIVEFVGPDSPFIVTAAGPVIRIWDALSKTSTGACVYTIRLDYQRTVSSICFSKSMMFSASQKVHRGLHFGADDSRQDIEVWALPGEEGEEGTLFKKLATLSHEFKPIIAKSFFSSSCGGRIEEASLPDPRIPRWTTAMTIMEEQYLLVTAHSDGVVNLWQYDDDHVEDALSDPNSEGDIASPVISHLRRLVFWAASGARISATIMAAPGSLLYVGDTKNLFCLDLTTVGDNSAPAPTEANNEQASALVVAKFSRVRDSMGVCASMMNCGHCGRYLIDRSSLCSACKRVRFCDRDCQKSGWASHKIACRAEVARQQGKKNKKV